MANNEQEITNIANAEVTNEGQTPEEEANEGQTNEGQTNEGQTNEGQTNEGQTNEGQTPEEETPEPEAPTLDSLILRLTQLDGPRGKQTAKDLVDLEHNITSAQTAVAEAMAKGENAMSLMIVAAGFGQTLEAYPGKVQTIIGEVMAGKEGEAKDKVGGIIKKTMQGAAIKSALASAYEKVNVVAFEYHLDTDTLTIEVNRVVKATTTRARATTNANADTGGQTQQTSAKALGDTYPVDHALGRGNLAKDSIVQVDGVAYTATELNKLFAPEDVQADNQWDTKGVRNLPKYTARTVYELAESGKSVTILDRS